MASREGRISWARREGAVGGGGLGEVADWSGEDVHRSSFVRAARVVGDHVSSSHLLDSLRRRAFCQKTKKSLSASEVCIKGGLSPDGLTHSPPPIFLCSTLTLLSHLRLSHDRLRIISGQRLLSVRPCSDLRLRRTFPLASPCWPPAALGPQNRSPLSPPSPHK